MDTRITAALRSAPRERFLRLEDRGSAHLDRPIRIGYGQTNSQPSTVTAMLELLAVQTGHRVLDVGAGSGWTTALLAELVGETGRVHGVELVPELRDMAATAVAPWPWASVHLASGETLGLPALAPFDRILVSAEARESIPQSLVAQLSPGGVMVVPVRGVMTRLTLTESGEPEISHHGHYSFVPLVEPEM